MRALVVLIAGLVFVLPAGLLLQQPRGPWSLVWDTLGLTLGLLGVPLILIGSTMAIWRLIRGA